MSGTHTTVLVDTVPCGAPSHYAPDTVLTAGTHYFYLSDRYGCDSLVVLTIQQAWVTHLYDTIQEGDRIIASRIEYNFHEPERYDIIIFKAPDEVAAGNDDVFYVKRVIGLPGETVTIVNGVVYVQGKDGKSEQLRDDFITACTPTGNFGPYVVPKDSYFVMGDNRESSVDSRYWTSTNYVHKDLIIGKAKFCYFPFNDAGKLE